VAKWWWVRGPSGGGSRGRRSLPWGWRGRGAAGGCRGAVQGRCRRRARAAIRQSRGLPIEQWAARPPAAPPVLAHAPPPSAPPRRPSPPPRLDPRARPAGFLPPEGRRRARARPARRRRHRRAPAGHARGEPLGLPQPYRCAGVRGGPPAAATAAAPRRLVKAPGQAKPACPGVCKPRGAAARPRPAAQDRRALKVAPPPLAPRPTCPRRAPRSHP
jgi:hypothetical protein